MQAVQGHFGGLIPLLYHLAPCCRRGYGGLARQASDVSFCGLARRIVMHLYHTGFVGSRAISTCFLMLSHVVAFVLPSLAPHNAHVLTQDAVTAAIKFGSCLGRQRQSFAKDKSGQHILWSCGYGSRYPCLYKYANCYLSCHKWSECLQFQFQSHQCCVQ